MSTSTLRPVPSQVNSPSATARASKTRRATAKPSAKALPRAPLEGATGGHPQPSPSAAEGVRRLLLPTFEALGMLDKARMACAAISVALPHENSHENSHESEGGAEQARRALIELEEALLFLGNELGDIASHISGERASASPLQHALALQDLLWASRSEEAQRELATSIRRKAARPGAL